MSEADPSTPYVRATVDAHVGWLAFDRAPVNAFEWTMVRQVSETLDRFERDPDVRVVVLASALPRYFSAGADLETFKGIGVDGMARWCELVHQLVGQFRASSKPMLAAIGGVAVGGGLEMTLHCDVRFAATDARLGQPEININFIPPVGATQALARLVGRPAALRYLYDGALLDAGSALRIGLVDGAGLRRDAGGEAPRGARRHPPLRHRGRRPRLRRGSGAGTPPRRRARRHRQLRRGRAGVPRQAAAAMAPPARLLLTAQDARGATNPLKDRSR